MTDCSHRRYRKIVKEMIANGGSRGYPFIHWIACAECDEHLLPYTGQSLWPPNLPPPLVPRIDHTEVIDSKPIWDYLS